MPWSRRQVRGDALAARGRLAVLVAVALVGMSVGGASALARTLTVRGAEMSGFGRLALEFEQPTKIKTRTTNGILVISFPAPVSIPGERLVREAPAYLAQVRRDPDGMGLRLALTQSFRVNVLEAGEKVFVDLLPSSWTGLPPGLPRVAAAAPARRAGEAEAKTREEERRRVERRIGLKVVQLPTLTRLIFDLPAKAPAAFKTANGEAELEIASFARLEAGDAKERLGPAVGGLETEASSTTLKIRLALGDGYEAKGARDDDSFLIDLAKPGAEPAAADAKGAAPAPHPAKQEAAKTEAGKPAPAAAGPS